MSVRLISFVISILVIFPNPALAGEVAKSFDDFESGLAAWRLVGAQAIAIVDSGDAAHAKVLELRADGLVAALLEDSDRKGPMRLEADFRFPEGGDAYLGLVYAYTSGGGRSDFGQVYVKADGSYLRANPFRDGNASRLLYEELRTRLTGERAIELGRWQRLAAEIDGSICHLYIEKMDTPAMTFDLYEGTRGLVGFGARVAGSPVWVDNVRLTPIEKLSWSGPPIPDVAYSPERLLTNWEVAGPFTSPSKDVELGHWKSWKPFQTDRRGAVVTGRVIQYEGTKPVAYFRTIIESDTDREVILHTTATEELALFVNGRFDGYIYRDGYVSGDNDWNAWYDFAENPDHAGRRTGIRLKKGRNEIVLRSRAGQFAAGGFFAALESPE